MEDQIINVCIDINKSDFSLPASVYVKELIKLFFANGLTDSSKITNKEIVKIDEFGTEIAITHDIVRGIGYTPLLEDELEEYLTPIVDKMLGNASGRPGCEAGCHDEKADEEDERRYDHSLTVLKKQIDRCIDNGNYEYAQQLIELYTLYKVEILGIP